MIEKSWLKMWFCFMSFHVFVCVHFLLALTCGVLCDSLYQWKNSQKAFIFRLFVHLWMPLVGVNLWGCVWFLVKMLKNLSFLNCLFVCVRLLLALNYGVLWDSLDQWKNAQKSFIFRLFLHWGFSLPYHWHRGPRILYHS